MAPWWLPEAHDEKLLEQKAPAVGAEAEKPKPKRRRRRRRRRASAESKGTAPTADRGTQQQPQSVAAPPELPAPRQAAPPEPPPASQEMQADQNALSDERAQLRKAEASANGSEGKAALLIDFENLALGVRDSRRLDQLDLAEVVTRAAAGRRLVVKRAYADWSRYEEHKGVCHQAGIELVDIPRQHMAGKNFADIRMVVDAMELCLTKPFVDTFVLASGDSDFSPLAHKLREHDRQVVGIGVRNAVAKLLVDACDQFVHLDDD